MARKSTQSSATKTVETLKHDEAKRKNIAEMQRLNDAPGWRWRGSFTRGSSPE